MGTLLVKTTASELWGRAGAGDGGRAGDERHSLKRQSCHLGAKLRSQRKKKGEDLLLLGLLFLPLSFLLDACPLTLHCNCAL